MDNLFKIIFLVCLIVAEVIRFPHRQRNKREMRQKKLAESRINPLDTALDLLAFTGMEIIPLIYIFTSWLDFANYTLPTMLGWFGATIFVVALWLLWRSHADLGFNWSPTLQITQEHKLVTQGVYHTIRHPIYAAMWLWGVAQVLLLQNWIAGMLGMDMSEMQRGSGRRGQPQSQPQSQESAPPAAEKKQEEKMPDPVNILRGILGR